MKFSRRDAIVSGLALSVPAMAAAPAGTAISRRIIAAADFGAVGDGAFMNTAALQAAIDKANTLGGGTVIVPSGRFVTGTLSLKSRTTLEMSKGTVLVGSDALADYPIRQVRWEGKLISGHSSLIQADDAEDIGLLGPGVIIGSDAVGGMPRKDYPLRHPALIEPVNCRRISLEGFTTSYEKMWNIHPTFCDDVTVRNLSIFSTKATGRDGIDIDSCRRVQIARCVIETGDDCISLKSGRGMEGYTLARPTEDVVISDCNMSGHNWACIGIGSEMSGGIRNVRIERCQFNAARTHALYLKGQVGRGGYVENIAVDQCAIRKAGMGVIRINFKTSGKRDDAQVAGFEGIPRISRFRFSRLRVEDVPQLLHGWETNAEKPLDGLQLQAITGRAEKGIELAHARNVAISNVDLKGLSSPLLAINDVTGAGLDGAVPLKAALVAPT